MGSPGLLTGGFSTAKKPFISIYQQLLFF